MHLRADRLRYGENGTLYATPYIYKYIFSFVVCSVYAHTHKYYSLTHMHILNHWSHETHIHTHSLLTDPIVRTLLKSHRCKRCVYSEWNPKTPPTLTLEHTHTQSIKHIPIINYIEYMEICPARATAWDTMEISVFGSIRTLLMWWARTISQQRWKPFGHTAQMRPPPFYTYLLCEMRVYRYVYVFRARTEKSLIY